MKGKDDKDRGSLFSNLQETLVPKGEGVVWDLGADQTWSCPTSKLSHMILPGGLAAGGKGGSGWEGCPPGGTTHPCKMQDDAPSLPLGCQTDFVCSQVLHTPWENLSSSTGDSPSPVILHSALLHIWKPASSQQLSTKSGSIFAMVAHSLAFILPNHMSPL